MPVITITWEDLSRKVVVQASQGKNLTPKITKGKGTGGMAQVGEHLPSKREALSSTAKKAAFSLPCPQATVLIFMKLHII
jgi:hypothetical protein